MTRWTLTVAVAGAIAVGSPARSGSFNDQLQRLLDRFRAEYGLPGATAIVALPDAIVSTVATGLADREARLSMTPDTRILGASIGKPYVAAVTLDLGKVRKILVMTSFAR